MPDNPNRGAVLISGASTGIGRACTEHLDGLGFTVLPACANWQTPTRCVAPDLGAHSRGCSTSPRASRLPPRRGLSMRPAPPAFGGLVNNAGISVGGPLEFVGIDEWRRQLEVNFIGQVAVTQPALPALRKARGPNREHDFDRRRLASPFLGPYKASKFAFEPVTDALRLELRQFGVEVPAVEPGAVATPIWEKGRASAEQATASMPAEAQRLHSAGIAGDIQIHLSW
jgi:NAD(P)-dependent dehydrogenase (short-subunit alcohol dehydrogenase family)